MSTQSPASPDSSTRAASIPYGNGHCWPRCRSRKDFRSPVPADPVSGCCSTVFVVAPKALPQSVSINVTRGVRVALIAALVALLAACGSLTTAAGLVGRLGEEGFANPNVEVSTTNGVDIVSVTVSGHSTLQSGAAFDFIAEIVWTTFPRHLDVLNVTVGAESGNIDRADLVAFLGPRDPALDAETIGGDFATTFIWLGIGFLVFLVGLVVLVVLLVRRSRRRGRQRPPMPPPPGSYAPPGYPTPPVGPPLGNPPPAQPPL